MLIDRLRSACAISIMGTYYRWGIKDSLDQSYDLVEFGQWTEAEVIVGFLLSCVPIMPKFFQHIGPKLHESWSRGFGSRTRTGSTELNGLAQDNSDDKDDKITRPSDTFQPLARQTREYIALADGGGVKFSQDARIEGDRMLPPETVLIGSESLHDGTTMV